LEGGEAGGKRTECHIRAVLNVAGRPADDEREHDRRSPAQAARERELVPAKCAEPGEHLRRDGSHGGWFAIHG